MPHQNVEDSQALSMNIRMVTTGHTICPDCAFLLASRTWIGVALCRSRHHLENLKYVIAPWWRKKRYKLLHNVKQQVPACKNSPDLVGTWRAKRLSQGWAQVYSHQGVWAHSYAEQDKQHIVAQCARCNKSASFEYGLPHKDLSDARIQRGGIAPVFDWVMD